MEAAFDDLTREAPKRATEGTMTPPKGVLATAFPTAQVSLTEAYLRGLPSEPTRVAYRSALRQFTEFLGRDLLEATRRDIEAFRAHLEDLGRAPQTVGRALSALTGLFDFALDEGLVERNPAARARRPKLPSTSPRQGVSATEVNAMLAVPDTSTPAGLRDRALLLVLAVQGWRISEALGLRVEDLGEEEGHRTATITGKGGRVDRVPLAAEVWMAIKAWIDHAGIEVGPVFVAVDKAGSVKPGTAISSRAAWMRIKRIAAQAGIKRKIHPHLFRHGAVTTALARGVALHQVQDFARHSDPRTTRRYDGQRASLSNPAPHVIAGALGGGRGR